MTEARNQFIDKDAFFDQLVDAMADRIPDWESMDKEPRLTADNDITSIYKKKTDKCKMPYN